MFQEVSPLFPHPEFSSARPARLFGIRPLRTEPLWTAPEPECHPHASPLSGTLLLPGSIALFRSSFRPPRHSQEDLARKRRTRSHSFRSPLRISCAHFQSASLNILFRVPLGMSKLVFPDTVTRRSGKAA